jgi:hypothetical protein
MLVIFNPAKLVYRRITGYRTDQFSSISVSEAMNAWTESFQETWSGSAGSRTEALERTAERLNNLTVNAAVINSVPGRVSYAMGEPWLAIPYSLIPRAIWEQKPDMTEITNDRFNIIFGSTTERIASRSTNSYPAIADGYWNFGWIGIVMSGILGGMFWRVIRKIWVQNSRIRYVFAFSILMNSRAPVAVPNLIIGVVQTLLACIVVVRILELTSSVFRTEKK